MGDSRNQRREYDLVDERLDHRTLFTLEELEAAYGSIMNEADALEAARLTMDGPIVAGQPAFFTDTVLDLLAALSTDAARRVSIARGHAT
jgi:hypothetical protein